LDKNQVEIRMSVKDQSLSALIKKRRELTLATFHRNNPTSIEMGVPSRPQDNETYTARKVGDMYLPPVETTAESTIPVYTITCTDTSGGPTPIIPLEPMPTTPYIIAPAASGSGAASILYYVDNMLNPTVTNIITTKKRKTYMPAPPTGTILVAYGFACSV